MKDKAPKAGWRKFISWIPLIGGLPDTTLYDHQDAFKETLFTLLFATLPIWGGALLAALIGFSPNPQPESGFGDNYLSNFKELTKDGLIVIYCASMMAPIFYTATKEYRKNARPFPSRATFITLVFLITFISGGYLLCQIIKYQIDQNIAYFASLVTLLITLFSLYLSTAYKLSIENINNSDYDFATDLSAQSNELLLKVEQGIRANGND